MILFPSLLEIQKITALGSLENALGVLLIWGGILWTIISGIVGLYIIFHYHADLWSVFWYWLNSTIVFWGLNVAVYAPAVLWPFAILTLVLAAIWAKRAGAIIPILGALGFVGWAYGSAFGYESEGFLK